MKPRLLVIRGGALGDFILTLPALRLLREAFPGVHLEIVGYEHIVALAEGRGYAEATRSIEYGAMASFFSPRAELPAELAAYFASFQQIVSWLFDPDGFFEGNLRRAGAKNILSAYRKPDDSDHAAKQLALPLQSLALYLDDPAARVYPSAEDHAAAEAFLGDRAGAPIVWIHPGSGSPKKNWPVGRWMELARRLREEFPECQQALVSGEADTEVLKAWDAGWQGAPLLRAQELPLPVLAALLSRGRLFLGHDSGISHLAAAVETPCVLLFGPTDPEIWAPAGAHVETLVAPEGDLEELGWEEVWERVRVRMG